MYHNLLVILQNVKCKSKKKLCGIENDTDKLCFKDVSQNDIDEVVDNLCNVLVSSAKETFWN